MAGQTSEVEETLKRLQGHKGVIGVVIVNQDGIPIRTTFDQAVTVQYAGLITQLCSKARSAVRELDPQVRNLACATCFPNHVTLIHQVRTFRVPLFWAIPHSLFGSEQGLSLSHALLCC
jgi:hypothetical protein